MAYQMTTLVIINSPDDYLSWPAARKVLRWRAAVRWHEYIEELFAAWKVRWCWGSHQLISKFSASPIVSTHVAIYTCNSVAEFSELLERDPLREYSSYMTVPLMSLEDDFNEEVREGLGTLPLPTDAVAVLAQQAQRGLYQATPEKLSESAIEFAVPPNAPAAPTARADSGDYSAYLLVGHGPQVSAVSNDAQRNAYTEKVRWWHAYNADLVRAGKVTHGWATGVLCHPGGGVKNKKGAMVVFQPETPRELTRLVNDNPLGEESDLVSVVLRPLGDQKESDVARLRLAEEELARERSLDAST